MFGLWLVNPHLDMALIIGLKPDKTSLSWLAGLPAWSLLDLQVGFRRVLATSLDGKAGLN